MCWHAPVLLSPTSICRSVGCWEFYILATSKVILTSDSAHSWWLYSAAPLENQATRTMTQYPTQSHYPDTEPTSPCPILLMPSARLGSDTYQFDKSLVWLDREANSRSPACALHSTNSATSRLGLQCFRLKVSVVGLVVRFHTIRCCSLVLRLRIKWLFPD